MKKFLEKLGIYTLNDAVCTFGGFQICLLVVELFMYLWVYDFDNTTLLWIMFFTFISTAICVVLDKMTR